MITEDKAQSMRVECFNMLRDVTEFVNENKIPRKHIFSIEENKMGTYTLIYFEDEE